MKTRQLIAIGITSLLLATPLDARIGLTYATGQAKKEMLRNPEQHMPRLALGSYLKKEITETNYCADVRFTSDNGRTRIRTYCQDDEGHFFHIWKIGEHTAHYKSRK